MGVNRPGRFLKIIVSVMIFCLRYVAPVCIALGVPVGPYPLIGEIAERY